MYWRLSLWICSIWMSERKYFATYLSLLPMECFHTWHRDLGWAHVHDHLLHVRLICWWGTPIPGWEPKRVEVLVQSHDHLLHVCLICQWDFSHTWMSTWTSRGTCVNQTIYYMIVSSTYGIYPIHCWEPRLVEVSGKKYDKCMPVISPSQGGIRSSLLQVFLESIQNSLSKEAWWEHL